LLTHDHFEQLCAAAVAGHITRDELVDLQEHMETCANCREFVGDVRQVMGPAILEFADKRSPVKKPAGAAERFIARAHSEGIPLGRKRPSQARWSRRQKGIVLFAVAAFIALFFLLYPKFLAEDRHPPSSTTKVIQPPTIPGENSETEALRLETAKLKEQVQNLQLQAKATASKIDSDREALKVADRHGTEISSRLGVLETANGDLQNSLDNREIEIARLKTVKDADEVALQANQSELNSVRERVATLSAALHQGEQLSAAAQDAKDIIGARNLLMFDVGDVNENGKRQRPYGRVFYADGKKLKFYAFDLTNPRSLDTKIQFYVWGEKNGAHGPVRTLGVLRTDSGREGRWKLDYDDPRVLAEIDSVFVTIESNRRPVTAPTGKKILYAYFGDRLNHP
jgi:hypothetical protein